jgi:hypothetical protein
MLERYRTLKNERDLCDLELRHIAEELKFIIGNHDGIEDLVSWKSEVQTRLVEGLVKENFPEVWRACRKEIIIRKFRLQDQPEDEEATCD